MNDENFKIQTYSVVELADKYSVSVYMFRKELKKIEHLNLEKYTCVLYPNQVEIIVKHLGFP